jgi:nucleotide-binding universal stress UspA family protein
MQKILVPTDLGRDALPGMRFAVQWSVQQKVKLLFTHVAYMPRLTRWTDKQYEQFQVAERKDRQARLEKMVADMYARQGITDRHHECLVIDGTFAEPTLLDYCRQHPDIAMVIMSTHGATGIQKIFGTHAGTMAAGSRIPVVVVPKGYRMKPVKSILYATDLRGYEAELQQVAAVAAPMKATLDVVHIVEADERVPDKAVFEKVLFEQCRYPVRIHFPGQDETRSMATNLRRQIEQLKPSLAVVFTDQGRTLLQKIFMASTAERMAFATPAPLMIFPKK